MATKDSSTAVSISGVSARYGKDAAMEMLHQADFSYAETKGDPSMAEMEFFGMTGETVDMVPQILRICKVAYEAVADAGLSMEAVKNSKTAILIDFQNASGTANTSKNTSIAERVAAVFSLQDDMHIFESQTHSGIRALDSAVNKIQGEAIESALIIAVNAGQHDDAVSVNSVILQRQDKCRRSYATILLTSTNVTNPVDTIHQLEKLHNEAVYVEVHETRSDDKVPLFLEGISQHSDKPVLVNYTSNGSQSLGFSGLSDIVRLIFWMKNDKLWSLQSSKTISAGSNVMFCKESMPWDRSLVTIYYSGHESTSSIITARFQTTTNETSNKEDQQPKSTDKQPRLLMYGATSEEGLNNFLSQSRAMAQDLGFYALLQESSTSPMPFKGYTALNKSDGSVTVVPYSQPTTKRPIWFVFPGAGCNWDRMGQDMMKFDIFRESMEKSFDVADKMGVDFRSGFKKCEDKWTDDFAAAMVGITAVQIGLVDMLFAMGIEPDGIIGHSLGENTASYADGCCTAEEQIASQCVWATAMKKVGRPIGKLAAVSLSWEECAQQCTKGVHPACHNAINSVTVTGTLPAVNRFVAQMKAKNIKATPVGAGYYPHCPIAAEICEKIDIQNKLSTVLTRRRRSSRWISTCYKEAEWGLEEAQHYGAEYSTYSFVNPVLFYDGMQKIPKNAVVIEIGPHGLLGNLVKKTVGPEIVYTTLMERNGTDSEVFLSALATLYANGVKFDPSKLYRDAKFPVDSSTGMVSPQLCKTWSSA